MIFLIVTKDNRSQKMQREAGLTLAEVMVVVILIALLAVLTIPRISKVLANYHLKEAARTVFSDLQLAKLTAVREGSPCVVRFATSGYAVFLDLNSNFVPDTSDFLIKAVSWGNFKDVQYGGNSFASNSIAFLPDSRTMSPGGGFGAGTLNLSAQGKQMRVVVNAIGNIRVQ